MAIDTAGYAMSAESTAAASSTAASEKSQGERPISELAEAVAALATPRVGCTVCHTLAEAENAEASRIANTVWPSGDELPPLCLHHLAHLASLQLLVGAPSLATSQAGRSGSLDFPEST